MRFGAGLAVPRTEREVHARVHTDRGVGWGVRQR